MKYSIFNLIPDLMFIKKNKNYFYDIYINYDWRFLDVKHTKVNFFRLSDKDYPRLLTSTNNYAAAKSDLDYYMGYLSDTCKEFTIT